MAGPADESKPNVNAPTAVKGPLTPKGSARPPAKPTGPRVLIGTTISDRYKIERLLGEGGMGAVYQAEHTLMRKRMAIKVLHPEMTRLPEVVARFEREAMAAAHIDHAHVVNATDFGKLEDGSFFLALEYVEGKLLREVIAMGRLDLGRALHIARQMASALQRAHALKIVHRDLKPENVMLVTKEGDPDFVKVLDFGIAKVQIGELTAGDVNAAASPGQPLLTQAGMVYGTPEYMAPEQALGQPVDARADLYALGCIMYEMFCGVRPFDAESKVALLGMQVTAPVPPMATKAPDANIPPEIENLVKRLLAKEASERLGDARELIEGISNLMAQLVASGKIDGTYAPPPRSALATNPNLLNSGIEPAPHLNTSSPDGSGKGNAIGGGATGKGLDALLGNKAWMIAAAGGLVGILVLVITIVVVLRGRQSTNGVDGEGGTTSQNGGGGTDAESPELSLDQKIKDAISQIDSGNYGSAIETLENLGPDAQNREDVHRALLKAYGKTGKPKEAMREVGVILKVNPSLDLKAPEGIVLRVAVRDLALQEGEGNKGAVDEAFRLLEGPLGFVGYDDLYDIAYGASGTNYANAAKRAKAAMLKADKSKMSPALAVTMDLQVATSGQTPNCGAVKPLLERAGSKGDERTLALLQPLTKPIMVGQNHWNKPMYDALGCIHGKDAPLTKAINELEGRLKKPH